MKLRTPLLIVSVILLLIANLGFWLNKTIYNPDNFSKLVVQSYEQPEVRNAIAGQIVDQVLQSKPVVKQVLADPVQSAIAGILNSQTFKSVFEKLAVKFQNYLTTDNRQDVTIEIGQVAPFVKAAANTISPDLGAQIPDVTPQTITIVEANSLPDINKWLKPIVAIGPFAGIISILILVYLFYRSENRINLLKLTGIFFLVGTILFGLLIPYYRTILQGNSGSQNAQIVATATYNTFASTLANQLLVIGGIAFFLFLAGFIWEMKINNNSVGKE